MNRLRDETSPYLRQHADNPVEWYPWGEEAFEVARATDRPLLISVGYSSCHWCHVMAHESFEDEATARLMNAGFVNVKVDREERPDVDAVYMEATQAMTGRGGWPMTVFAHPDGRPFYCGTYFPKERRGGMPSFTELLAAVHDAWTTKREELIGHAEQLTSHLQRTPVVSDDALLPDAAVLADAAETMLSVVDSTWGGFGRAPKFPQAMALDHLLRHHVRTGSQPALDAVTASLDAMASGGIYDHLGGGFSRYSVDDQWLVPHFEKMLYDNALLARAYLHAWQVTGEARYRHVLDETVGYVLRDLRHADGGFFSAEDADSLTPAGHSEEGAFFTWTPEEVADALEPAGLGEHTAEVCEWYGIATGGNFEGRSIPNRIDRRGALERPPVIEQARVALFEARRQRHRPGLDDKVLTEWNGLMLASLAEAAFVTGDDEWLDHAVRNAEFLIANLRREDGRWLRAWQDGRADGRAAGARHLGVAADYGAVLHGFLSLYEATGVRRWFDVARSTADELLALFWDPQGGGLFTVGEDAESLVARTKDLTDSAVPSANSLAAAGLLRLEALTDERRYGEHARTILRLVGPALARSATAFGLLLWAVELEVAGRSEIVVTGNRPDLVEALRAPFLPLAVRSFGEPLDGPLWRDRADGAAFVCTGFTCMTPANDIDALRSQLSALRHM